MGLLRLLTGMICLPLCAWLLSFAATTERAVAWIMAGLASWGAWLAGFLTDPLGHTTKYAYDANGNLESLTDPNGHTTTYTYDANDEPTKVKQPNGTVTECSRTHTVENA